MNFLNEKFNIIETVETKNGVEKFVIDKKDLLPCLSFLKENQDMLLSITAVDLAEKIEVIYDLYSSQNNKHFLISVKVYSDNPVIESVTKLFKSAAFDEREIFDLFGVEFDGNDNLKRLLLPDFFVGNPMLKNFKPQRNERQNYA